MKRARLAAAPADGASAAQDVRAAPAPATGRARRRGSRGQVLVIFAGALIALLSLCAVVIDVSWYWASTLRVQRAADAAALAGVVSLPGDIPAARGNRGDGGRPERLHGEQQLPGGRQDARRTSPGCARVPDPNNDRQLDVTVSEPVNTFFMRLIGINSITATRSSKALYVLPVPMGSPAGLLRDLPAQLCVRGDRMPQRNQLQHHCGRARGRWRQSGQPGLLRRGHLPGRRRGKR